MEVLYSENVTPFTETANDSVYGRFELIENLNNLK
jgi:hypothetical protein